MIEVYLIDWVLLAQNFLPMGRRLPKFIAFAKALILPIALLHSEFLTFRQKSIYKITHTSQICYMEGVLNDEFDPSLRRIRIANTVFATPTYLYYRGEDRPVYLYRRTDNNPVYLKRRQDFVGDGVDFVVYVPPDLQPDNEPQELAVLTKMRGLIDYYKLYSKNYIIKWELLNI